MRIMAFLTVFLIVIGAIILILPFTLDIVDPEEIKSWFVAAALMVLGAAMLTTGFILANNDITEPIPRHIERIEVYETRPSNAEPLYRIWIEDEGIYYYILLNKEQLASFEEKNCQIYISKRQMDELTTSKNLRGR